MTDEELNRKFDIVAQLIANLSVSHQQAEERMNRADADTARLRRTLLTAIRAGRRERTEWREKFAALTDAQRRTEESLKELAESQKHTDRRLDALIDVVREEREEKDRRRRREGPNGEGPRG